MIGVVTSPTGAVIRDILHRLEDRCPTHVILWPVPVQGEGAAARIAEAIRGFPSIEPRPDLLIVARGGGSIEDLWAFNEEEVVRAAAESPIPLISAVGHETDTTLIDFAADLRAPTPTAAAEMAVPVRAELFAQLAELGHRAQQCLARRAERCRERFDLTVCRWPEPAAIVRAAGAAPRRTRRAAAALARRARRERPRRHEPGRRPPSPRAGRSADRAAVRAACRRLEDGRAGASRTAALERGFARVTDRAGKTLIRAADARAARELRLHFGDGEVDAAGRRHLRRAAAG